MSHGKKNKQITAAPYSPTSEPEIQAITVLRTLIKLNKIHPHLSESDKTPNIDGYLELKDKNRVPIGKLEVQVKKLPKKFEKDPKFPCPTSLIKYAKYSTTIPVLLICVDVHHNKAYWISIDDLSFNESFKKVENGQKTITIHFPAENCIDGKNLAYFDYWKAIFDKYWLKIKEFDNLSEEYNLLRERSNPIIGVSNPEIREIHSYLDQLNNWLDFEFGIVKKTFFPNSWKVGFAYHEFDDERVTYEHYPIPMDKNDVQIKQIEENLEKEIRKTRLELISYFKGNPFRSNPTSLATKYIEDKVGLILKNHLLDHKVDEVFAREFVFAFIDNFHTQMGLEEKDRYSIKDIENGFFKYLPLWISEVVVHPHINSLYLRTGYHDPSFYLTLTPVTEREKIDENVRTKILNNYPIPFQKIGNKDFPFGIFQEMIAFLKTEKVQEIERVYSKKDHSRISSGPGPRWIWNVFSKINAERNLKIFFDHYPRIYNAIVEKNFPNIKSELPVFNGATLVIVVFDLKDEYSGPVGDFTYPFYYMYYLQSNDSHDLKIKFIPKDKFDNSDLEKSIENGRNIEVDGQPFKVIGAQGGCMDFIFENLPLFHFLYDSLQRNISSYFKNQKT